VSSSEGGKERGRWADLIQGRVLGLQETKGKSFSSYTRSSSSFLDGLTNERLREHLRATKTIEEEEEETKVSSPFPFPSLSPSPPSSRVDRLTFQLPILTFLPSPASASPTLTHSLVKNFPISSCSFDLFIGPSAAPPPAAARAFAAARASFFASCSGVS